MTNRNDRGSSEDRRRRREFLMTLYRADVDADEELREDWNGVLYEVPLGEGQPACRCFRCGKLLSLITMTIDRIIPGCRGGTYRRNNIRPACADCNNEIAKGLKKREPSVRNAS